MDRFGSTPDVNNGLPSGLTSFVMPDDPPPMPSVASSDDETNSLDSFEVLSHDMESETPVVVDEKKPAKPQELSVSLDELRISDMRKIMNSQISMAEENSAELQEQQHSVASAGALSTSGSTHSQVEHLIHTNEMLRQNAMHLADNMRSQRDKVEVWQKEVHQCLTNYRNKLIESRSQVAILKTDNHRMSEEIRKLICMKVNLEQDVAIRTEQLEALGGVDVDEFQEVHRRNMMLSEEKHALIIKIQELTEELEAKRSKNVAQPSQNDETVADLVRTVELKNSEIANMRKLKVDSEHCHKQQLKTARDACVLMQEQVEYVASEGEKMKLKYEDSQRRLKEVQQKLESIKKKKEEKKKKHDRDLQSYVAVVTAQLQKAKETARKTRLQSEEELKECTQSLLYAESELEQALMTIKRHEDTISGMGKMCAVERDRNEHLTLDLKRERSHTVEFKVVIEKLQKDRELALEEKQSAIDALEQARKDHAKEIEKFTVELTKARAKLDSPVPVAYPEDYLHVREQLANAQIQILNLEEMIAKKDGEIESTVKAFDEAKALNDTIFALKAQLELYKSDFELEQNLKKNMQEERDQLHEDLQNLHRRNQQLQDELELLREHSDTVVLNGPSAPPAAKAAGFNPRGYQGYSCPKCKVEFDDYGTLEEHIELCL